MAAPECEREVRKRRERRDSGCGHERKERRPHSEERLPPPPPPPPLHDCNRLESERRAERLSRARRPQYGKRRRTPTRQHKQPKENDCFTTTEEIRCSTPTQFEYSVSPKPLYSRPALASFFPVSEVVEPLDAGLLQLQVLENDGPQGSLAEAERARHDERSTAPMHARRDHTCPNTALHKISKKITTLKKNITKHEEEFEALNGYAITASDRMTDVQLTRMYENLRRLQAEKKLIKNDPVEYALRVQAAKQQKERDENLDRALKSEKSMSEVVVDIEEWLEGCRAAAGRAALPESSWSCSQLAAEKCCVQRALLRLEAARGRPPAHSAERGAARHLYERYRSAKRTLAAARPDSAICIPNGELATIHEHEAMLFTSVDSSDSQEKPSDSSQAKQCSAPQPEAEVKSPPSKEAEEIPSSTSSAKSGTTSDDAPNEGLHFLSLSELATALSEAKLQKCVLRRTIKEYEVSFEMQNSRKVQRDDKKGHEEDYSRYKAIKARIKLLNALINKQKSLLSIE